MDPRTKVNQSKGKATQRQSKAKERKAKAKQRQSKAKERKAKAKAKQSNAKQSAAKQNKAEQMRSKAKERKGKAKRKQPQPHPQEGGSFHTLRLPPHPEAPRLRLPGPHAPWGMVWVTHTLAAEEVSEPRLYMHTFIYI